MIRKETTKSLLKKVPIFKELSDEEMDAVIAISYPRNFKKRMLVFMQDDPLDKVYFIDSGKVKIYRNDLSGKEQIVSVLQPGDMFPHAGFFRKGNYPAHAEIIEDGILIVIPIDDFEKMLVENPKVCIKLFRVMGDRIVDLQNRLEEQILHNSYEQIVKLLIRLSEHHGVELEGNRFQLTTHFTNREMANMIGSSRETVSRTINQFKKKEIIKTDDAGFFIVDVNLLENELINM